MEFTKHCWVAISETGNVFTSTDLQLKQQGDKVINDIQVN